MGDSPWAPSAAVGALSPVHVPGRGDMPVPCRAGRAFRKVPSGRRSCPLTLLQSCCGVVLTGGRLHSWGCSGRRVGVSRPHFPRVTPWPAPCHL